jgi:hypothetical protein
VLVRLKPKLEDLEHVRQIAVAHRGSIKPEAWERLAVQYPATLSELAINTAAA